MTTHHIEILRAYKLLNHLGEASKETEPIDILL